MSSSASRSTAASGAFRYTPKRRSRRRLFRDDADVRKVAVLLRVVEAVPHHKLVLDGEADVFNGHVDFPPRRLAEQAGGAESSRRARPQDVLQVGECQAGIDDVLDDDDVAAFETGVEVLQQLHLSGRLGARAVAGYRDEVHRRVAFQRAREIGKKHERALEDAYQVNAVGMIAADFGGKAADAFLDLV